MFTGLRTARKALRQVDELNEWAQQAGKAIKRLQEELQELRAAHAKLRGKYYGELGASSSESRSPPGDSREARKAAAFKSAGIKPGQPVRLEN